MNDMADFYQQQAQARLSTTPWLAQIQKNALTALGQYGLPTRHDEEWKYTQVDATLVQSFVPTYAKDVAQPKHITSPFTYSLQIINGELCGLETLTKSLPAGVLVLPLALALVQHPDLIKPHLGTILEQEHGFHALNTAMIKQGVFIYIPEGLLINEPLVLTHIQDTANQAVYLRHVIVAGANSQATILEAYQGEENGSYLTNTVTEIAVERGAKLTHYKLQQESKSALHLGHIAVKQAKSSAFESHSFSLGGQLARSDLSIYLNEEGARCLMNGMYVTGSGQHADNHTTVHHTVPNCLSEQDYKGILSGNSCAVFNGKIKVFKDAQHTEAKQQNKNLLLSKQAQVNTKPQLEIFANDVQCSHGATIGQLDEEALFYLATRGIDRLAASHYLIHAFAIDNLRLISNPNIAQWIEPIIMKQVEAL